jgi:ubiquinone/menaquinone biosynthesis C-methylase UbiE
MTKSSSYQDVLHSWAKWYDNLEVKDILPTAYIQRHLEEYEIYDRYLEKDKKILEAGCGLGNQVIFLTRKGFKVFGVDYAQDALKKVKSFDSALSLSAADVHSLPFKDNIFHAYLSFGVLEHFPFGPMPALKEAKRVLADNGIIVMSLPSNYLLARIASGQAENSFGKLRNNYLLRKIFKKGKPQEAIFAFSYSKKEVVNFLKDAGFSILTVKPTGHDFIWYTLIPLFRKNARGITNPVGEKFAHLVRKFFPWRSCLYTFIVARKIEGV